MAVAVVVVVEAVADLTRSPQRRQYPLTKEYTLSERRIPNMI